LSSPGPFTVFAPENKAFADLPYDSLSLLLQPENKDALVSVLTNHVLTEEIRVEDFSKYSLAGKYAKTVEGGLLSLSYFGTPGLESRVCVVSSGGLDCKYPQISNIKASNGIIHTIDGVLVPVSVEPLPNTLASGNIVELAQSVSSLSTLVTAVVAADLVGTLSSSGHFTVFAPTNDAFAALPAGTLDSLLQPANKEQLVDILTYHVLPDQKVSGSISTAAPFFNLATTVEGKPLRITNKDGVVMVGPDENLKVVTSADNFATNGVVHIIDGVMLPAAVATDRTIRLTSRCSGSGNTFDIQEGVCYQLSEVPESTQHTDQRVICQENGDAFLLKYSTTDGSCGASAPFRTSYLKEGQCLGSGISGLRIDCSPKSIPNIVELAETVSDLSTLVAAVVAGDLVDTLSSPGPFTVFAPTNAGFAALPKDVLDSLMKPANKAELVDILKYHVLSGSILSTDLQAFQEVDTVEGKKLHVTVFGGVVKVGPSLLSKDLKTVTAADNLASNGVVHIVDGVLLPPSSILV
jgi:uncharacterized surface protein with fasciclin (FAS1) repeats